MTLLRTLGHAEKLDWLRLIRSIPIGPKTFYKLLELYGSAAKALEHIPEMAKRGGRHKNLIIYSKAQAEKELEEVNTLKGRMIASIEPDFPPQLRHIPDCPPIITLLGQTELLQRPMVAIIGARNASANGCRFAENMAKELGYNNYIVVSGLARGIDTATHRGALPYGTIGVVAGGINIIYPKENTALYHNIAEQGAIIAELPLHATPKAQNFPQRNRIISGVSLGIVVVEASIGSGSLITARMALEQGREVCAVPGSPLDPRASGSHALLKQGATLVESAKDVIEALSSSLFSSSPTYLSEPLTQSFVFNPSGISESELTRARPRVIEKLSTSPVSVEDIIQQTGQSVSVVWIILIELELAGKLERQKGNNVSLISMDS